MSEQAHRELSDTFYDNVEVSDDAGRRSHVTLQVNEPEARVVRKIFEMTSGGDGRKKIAKSLNAEGAPSPRAQQGRPNGWAPSSIREILYRPLYKGVQVCNRTKKRNNFGVKKQTARPAEEHITISAPQLQIVSEELWDAAHVQMGRLRKVYSGAQLVSSRPKDARDLKYLLSGNVRCSVCGGSLVVQSRSHGRRRVKFYGCSSHHQKGQAICANNMLARLEAADDGVLTSLETDLLRPGVVRRVIAAIAQHYSQPRREAELKRGHLERELARSERQLERLTAAIRDGGGEIPALVSEMKKAQENVEGLRAELEALSTGRPLSVCDSEALSTAVRDRLADLQRLLRGSTTEARRVIEALVEDRFTFTPRREGPRCFYEFRATGTVRPILEGIVEVPCTRGGVPNGIDYSVELVNPRLAAAGGLILVPIRLPLGDFRD